MKINFSDFGDLKNFVERPVDFCGINSFLVFPSHIGAKFTQKNKIFRSSIWDKDGNLLSAGFPKFKNAGEDPDNFPMPKSIKKCEILTKADGSLCIVDFVNGKFNARTRGTACYTQLENYKDFEYCFDKYNKIKKFVKEDFSLLFESVSPNQRIVLDYGQEPDLILIGAINKKDYSLFRQKELDKIAKEIGVSRPEYHSFDSFDEISEFCEKAEGTEGFCLYFNEGQSIVKVKTSWYLALHRMKSELGSYKRVVDVFLEMGMPDFNSFYSQLVEIYDYEIAEQARPHVSIICDAWKEVQKIEEGMHKFVKRIAGLDTRKEQALEITSSYGGEGNNRAGFVFKILDGQELEIDDYKKLLFQVSKVKE